MERAEMPRRVFGRTGERVGLLGMGVWAPDEREHIEIVRRGIDAGISFQDTSWDYHDGRSETRLGKALKDGYRDRVFLETKIDARTRGAAERQIRESLRRLDVEYVDLLQFHEVIRPWEPRRIFAEEDGGIHAVLAARQAGLARFIGFTGHKDPSVMNEMLDVAERNGFLFDACQMPLSAMDPHYRSFQELTLPRLVETGCAIIGMKPLGGRGHFLRTGTLSKAEFLRYTMSLPLSVCLTGFSDMGELEEALDVARDFLPLTSEEMVAFLERTAEVNAGGAAEHYKISDEFDGTTRHPEWLGVHVEEHATIGPAR